MSGTRLIYPRTVDEMLALFQAKPGRTDVVATQAVMIELCQRLMVVEVAVERLGELAMGPQNGGRR